MRTIYWLASYILMPLFMVHLAWRGLRDKAYLRRWSERFGFYAETPPAGGIVVHAASVGEINAAESLIRALSSRYPQRSITITSFTPTGSARVRALFGNRFCHAYVPFDLPGSVKRFFKHHQPALLVVMETEIWPHLFVEASRLGTPIVMANARLSEKSYQTYHRFRSLARMALEKVTYIAAQSEADAGRLIDLGAVQGAIEVSGNLKFDMTLAGGLGEKGRSFRQSWGAERPVFLAGSTHAGDEQIVFNAFVRILQRAPQALLIIVPRHPERFQACAQKARNSGLSVQLKSQSLSFASDINCLVVDVMGELLPFYAASDVAFVGGSIDRIGGQNVLEPAALSIPVLVGPHTFNFEDITRRLLSSGGGARVHNDEEMALAVLDLFENEPMRRHMGEAGRKLVAGGQGALAQTMQTLGRLMD